MDIFGRKRIKILEQEIQKMKDEMFKEHKNIYRAIDQTNRVLIDRAEAL